MQIVSDVAPAVAVPAVEIPSVPAGRWSLAARLAFRCSVVYFTLYILATQMFYSMVVLPVGRVPGLGESEMFQGLVTRVATDVLGFSAPLTRLSGSGDKPYDWTLAFCLLVFSLAATAIWSVVDRRRAGYPGLHTWFRVFLRFGLGGTMLTYGMIKAIPLQMPYPNLTRLLEPYGHFSLMGVLWAQMGASPAYQTFTGVIELSAAILLFVPGLTLLGALVSLAAATQVFVLNMTYDTPVKLFSFHLIVMSLVLIAPDARRLLDVLVLNRPAGSSPVPPLARSRTARRVLGTIQVVVGAWLVYSSFTGTLEGYRTRGGGAPRPPLYGIWNVETMSIDGTVRSPLVTDYDRWRRVVIQNAVAISFQRMDDTFTGYGAKVDVAARIIALTRGPAVPGSGAAAAAAAGTLTFEQPDPDRLILDGEIDGRKVRMEARHYDRSNFRLVQSRFRWVQDFPFNR
jgi:hypothetical protein